jgi:hypothetical protein
MGCKTQKYKTDNDDEDVDDNYDDDDDNEKKDLNTHGLQNTEM